MDPDVVVLGEMRDEETDSVMLRAAITGHLVFSTLHTNTAPDIITRLVDLGASRSLLASRNLLVCLLCQRLLPLLCENCALPITQDLITSDQYARWQARFADHFPKIKIRNPQGCSICQGLGIRGRTVAAELIWADDEGRSFIQTGDLLGWQHYLADNGWRTYADRVLDKVIAGLCDPVDAEHLIGQIQPANTSRKFLYLS
jgi:type II secretory ATPase GspE/PulE/Tfp pilus assembly ATPase PilB-like protein